MWIVLDCTTKRDECLFFSKPESASEQVNAVDSQVTRGRMACHLQLYSIWSCFKMFKSQGLKCIVAWLQPFCIISLYGNRRLSLGFRIVLLQLIRTFTKTHLFFLVRFCLTCSSDLLLRNLEGFIGFGLRVEPHLLHGVLCFFAIVEAGDLNIRH